jgi:glycosyltransferase involved in cell wall biosynthesis
LFVDFGLKSTTVEYDIMDRAFGKTKFNYAKLTQLALNGITSFSNVPLRLVAIMGVTISFISFAVGIYAIWARYIARSHIPHWTPEIVGIAFLAGIQIFCIGVIGEYLGMIYNEVKARPRYITDDELM